MDFQAKDLILIILSILFGYIINLTTPNLNNKLQNWRDKRSQERAIKSVRKATKRLKKLNGELDEIRTYTENTQKLVAHFFLSVMFALVNIFLFLLFVFTIFLVFDLKNDLSIRIVMLLFGLYTFGRAFLDIRNTHTLAANIRCYESYEERTQKQIDELRMFIANHPPVDQRG
ncbi:MAG TPA: hypothetical protein VH186_06260 [Chloroflexia bacterium]|nr:hypothetical protein [Chloroflexia bacterium]